MSTQPAAELPHGFNTDSVADEVLTSLRRFTAQIERFAEGFAREAGLRTIDFQVIALLLEKAPDQPTTPSELSTRLGLSPSTMTAVLDRLQAGGHVDRVSDPADRRRSLVQLLPESREAAVAYFEPMYQGVLGLLNGRSDDDIQIIRDFLVGVVDTTATLADG